MEKAPSQGISVKNCPESHGKVGPTPAVGCGASRVPSRRYWEIDHCQVNPLPPQYAAVERRNAAQQGGVYMTQSNYAYTQQQMQRAFLQYDQAAMVEKFRLEQDAEYLYLSFVRRPYRVHRATGLAEWIDSTGQPHPAGFNDAMSIYDVLCCSKPCCRLSGRFAPINSIARSFQSSGLGDMMFQECAPAFAQRPGLLDQACAALDGVKEGKGDISYRLETFPFLPVQLRFWRADDEFPASLQLLWDENTLDFVHYETTYYIAGHLFSRLRELMDQA